MMRRPDKEGARRRAEIRTEERRESTSGKKEMKVPCRVRKTGRRGELLHTLVCQWRKHCSMRMYCRWMWTNTSVLTGHNKTWVVKIVLKKPHPQGGNVLGFHHAYMYAHSCYPEPHCSHTCVCVYLIFNLCEWKWHPLIGTPEPSHPCSSGFQVRMHCLSISALNRMPSWVFL